MIERGRRELRPVVHLYHVRQCGTDVPDLAQNGGDVFTAEAPLCAQGQALTSVDVDEREDADLLPEASTSCMQSMA